MTAKKPLALAVARYTILIIINSGKASPQEEKSGRAGKTPASGVTAGNTGCCMGLRPNGAPPAFRPYPSLHLKHAADRRGDYQQQQADR